MKAVICERYGGPEVLELKDEDKPLPKENEVLIRIYSAAVNSGDVRLRKADPFAVRFMSGLLRPSHRIPGIVFSGEIEAVGTGVNLFKAGDKVYGMSLKNFGAYAEYICVPQDGIVTKIPVNLLYDEAASIVFGSTSALHFLRKANITKGQKVLIYGASGAVGTAAVQLAKHFGAEVTGVCSTVNVAFVTALGAGKVVDYIKEDFSKSGE